MDFIVAGTDLGDRTFDESQQGRLTLQWAATDGEIGQGTFVMPDPSGDDNFRGHREFKVADGAVTLFDGFIGPQIRTRERPLWPQREQVYTIGDVNSLIYQFIVYQERPEETVADRWRAFLDEYRADWDQTWVLDTEPVTMPAKVYRGDGGFDELIRDTIEIAGKTFFVVTTAAGVREAHMHRLVEGRACELEVNDEAWDYVDVFPPLTYPHLTTNPQQLFNYVVARDQAGRRIVHYDQTSIDNHDVDGMRHQKLVDFEADTTAELQQQASQYIAEHKLEAVTYEVEIGPLDTTAMAKWQVGDLLPITSQVLGMPGTVSPVRIAYAEATPWVDVNGTPLLGLWKVRFELGAPLRTLRRPSSGTGLPSVPFIPQPAPTWAVTMDSPPSESDNTDLPHPTFTVPDGHNVTIVYTWGITGPLPANGWAEGEFLYEVNGVIQPPVNMETLIISNDDIVENLSWRSGGVFLSYKSSADIEAAAPPSQPTIGIVAPGVDDWILTITGIRFGGHGSPVWNTAATLTASIVDVIDADTSLSLYGEQAAAEPKMHQWNYEEIIGDGTTGPYTTNYAYEPHSLEVMVNGQWVPIDQTDPDAGEFETLASVGSGVPMFVKYQFSGGISTGETNPYPSTEPTAYIGGLEVEDDGVSEGTGITTLDFAGAGVSVAVTGNEAVVTIPGGGGSSMYFNVMDYGAVGDDTADDTSAIQDAIDAAIANGGGTVYFPTNTYKITAALVSTSGGPLTFLGDNPWTSIIRQHTANTNGLTLNGLNILEKLQVLGPTGNSSGVGIDSPGTSAYIQMKSVRTVGFFIGVRHGSQSWYARMYDCWVYDADSIGIQAVSGSNNVDIVSCYVHTCPVGVDFAGAQAPRYINGSIESCTTAGIRINGGTNAAGAYIAGTYFEQGDGVPDILIGNSSVATGTTITGTTHVKSSYTGTGWAVDAQNADGLTITSPHIDSDDAIRATGSCEDVVVINPRLRNAGTVTLPSGAIYIDDSSNAPADIGTTAAGTSAKVARADHVHEANADDVIYDNGVSGLTASDVQGAIDELADGAGGGGIGPILISDTPSTPLVFADLIQNEAQDDLVYADP